MKKLLGYIILILLFAPVAAQEKDDIIVEVDYPSVVRAGQQFTISYSVNAGGGDFAVPSFQGFYKLMGPSTSYSSSTQIINGKWSSQTTYSYSYVLQAMDEGKYTFPPAQFTLKNKTFYSDSVRIEVISGNAQTPGNVQQGNRTETEEEIEAENENLFVSLILSRKEVYLGEGILATVKIYTRQDLSGISEIKYPGFTGFMKTDLETPPLNQLRQENLNGTVYGTGVIQQFLLYPQITGEIVIDPVQVTVLVQQKSGVSDPFFGDFFSAYQTVRKPLISRKLKVMVKPLPGTKPDDFSGVVGSLSLTASINRDTVNVNDAVNLKIVASGTGNLKLAEAPGLSLSPDLETYDPKITDNFKSSAAGTSGQRTFEFLLIPRHYGNYTIPPVTYSYFNTATGKYEQLRTREFTFHARKGNEQDSGITVYGGVSKQDVKYLGKDIRFIREKTGKLRKSAGLIVAKRSFYSIYAASFLIFIAVLFIRREHIRRNSDINVVRNRKAGRIASKRLREASLCMKKGEKERFQEEILKALWGYLSDKLGIPVAELTRASAVSALMERGVGEDKISEMTGLLDRCEYARYAPSGQASELSDIFSGASRFISSIENKLG